MSNLYKWYVYRKDLTCRKHNFCQSSEILKIEVDKRQKNEKAKIDKKAYSAFALKNGHFSIFLKMDKNAVSYISRPFYGHIACKD